MQRLDIVWDLMLVPKRVKKIQIQRALFAGFVFCFSPITKVAVQLLVCLEPARNNDPSLCQNGEGHLETCEEVMALDWSMSCSS
eukprot:SAG22_NODE_21970_length_252_cov_1.013072_1_plen_83_part_11